jgi:hypothetical protein
VLEFRETPLFTKRITQLLSDDDYSRLQGVLVIDPEAGDVIPGTSGIRKMRWSEAARGKGKRGGIRLIYYRYAAGDLIYMLYAYSKNERDDLTAAQKRALMQVVAEEFR